MALSEYHGFEKTPKRRDSKKDSKAIKLLILLKKIRKLAFYH
jgi:hypothetical protein